MTDSKTTPSRYLGNRITRRQAIRAGGLAAMGLVFSKPIIETFGPKPAFANYAPPPPPTTGPCVVTFNIMSAVAVSGDTQLRFRVCATGNCKDVSFVAFGLQQAGLTVLSPADGSTYIGAEGSYNVEHTNFHGHPGFPSVKFESTGNIFNAGECEDFVVTVAGTGHSGTQISYILAKLGGSTQSGAVIIP